jgi:hypothetical protein
MSSISIDMVVQWPWRARYVRRREQQKAEEMMKYLLLSTSALDDDACFEIWRSHCGSKRRCGERLTENSGDKAGEAEPSNDEWLRDGLRIH